MADVEDKRAQQSRILMPSYQHSKRQFNNVHILYQTLLLTNTMLFHVLVVALGIGVAQSSSSTTRGPICQDLTLHLEASAQNFALPPYLPSTDARAVGQYLSSFNPSIIKQNVSVSGTYAISATYCRPVQKVPSRDSTIQLLLHGVGYTKVRR